MDSATASKRRSRLLSIASLGIGIGGSAEAVDTLIRAAEDKKNATVAPESDIPPLPVKSSETTLSRSGSVWGKLKRMASTKSVRRKA